jgi:hypothetical protein
MQFLPWLRWNLFDVNLDGQVIFKVQVRALQSPLIICNDHCRLHSAHFAAELVRVSLVLFPKL